MNAKPKRLSRQFGDYQTPPDLAQECCQVIRDQLGDHQTLVEPTCGKGNFLFAATDVFQAEQFHGMEQDANYVRAARRAVVASGAQVKIRKQNFFDFDWNAFRDPCGESVLYFGNPPWVTHSEISARDGENLPEKSNMQADRGIDAITGKSNFDLAESMIQTLLAAMRPGKDSLAMLVKSATVRRVADHAWKRGYRFGKLHFYPIDAKEYFDASVDAGLMLFSLRKTVDPGDKRFVRVCRVFDRLSASRSKTSFGQFDGKLVRDPRLAKETSHLAVPGKAIVNAPGKRSGDRKMPLIWRSGVKHDLAGVLEMSLDDNRLINRNGDCVDIEPDLVFPLAKGSEVAGGLNRNLSRAILIPQSRLGESTLTLRESAPKTYAYLIRHRKRFEARRSSIYRSRDPFAIFGVGDYTFSPWKIAICGLYKRLSFTVYGPIQRKPVVFDDTTYLLPCRSRNHAQHVKRLLESNSAEQFFNARIFWEAKRPINATVLRSLDLRRVAQEEGIKGFS